MLYHEPSTHLRINPRVWLSFAGTFLAFVVVMAWVGVVQAGNCGFRCYAKAWQNNVSLAGVRASWDIQDLQANDQNQTDRFILQDLWGITSFAGDYEWVEVGYRQGWPNDPGRLGFFWAEQVNGYGYGQYRITSPAPGSVGSEHEFMINYTGDQEGFHVFKVYINGQCVVTQEAVGCGSVQSSWIIQQQIGAEATGDTSVLGPTHVFNIKNRASPSGSWVNWQPVDTPEVSLSNSMFEWTGDYNNAVYGEGIFFRDSFNGPDGSDPDHNKWPATAGYWSESGGNIFVHKDPNHPSWSHLHGAYDNAGGYLLMRRDKNDTYSGSTIVVEFGYGEDSASQAGRFFGVWNSGDSTQMSMGVHTGQWPNTYFYRVSNSTALTNTEIARTGGWHTFRFYVTSSGCSYGELDGTSLASLGTNCSITPGTLNKWGVASTWGLTDPPNLDAIWDNAVYFHR